MYDPGTRATSTLLTLQTRADHESSNDGVLGMALDPDFATNRQLYVYYSPRQDPGCNSCLVVGHNVISRFTLNAAGTAVVAGSEQEILRVPKVKVGNDNRDGVAGQNTYSAHVGGGSISFDSAGDLYIGTGDDVDPFGAGGNGYAPLDQRYPERYDARNTAANTNDLRGKVLRIRPLANAAGGAGAGTTYSIPPGQHVRPRHGEDEARDLRHGLPQPVHGHDRPGAPGHGPGRRLRAGRRDQLRHPRPGRDHRVEPRHQARLLRLAAVRGRQRGRQLLLPLHVPQRPVRHPLRLRGGGDPQRVAEQLRPDEPARARRGRRRLAQAHGRPSRALRDPDPLEPAGVDLRPGLRLRRRQPVGHEVAGVLRRRVADPRPRAELVA